MTSQKSKNIIKNNKNIKIYINVGEIYYTKFFYGILIKYQSM
jgi:hypothetical protein